MRLPVLKAFSATFAYVFRHGGDLAKALWLPALLLVAVEFYAMPPFFSGLGALIELGEGAAPEDVAPVLLEILKWAFVLTVASAILYPMMTVASLRHLVRGETLAAPFYLRFGGDEARVLAAYILVSVMLLLIQLVGELAVAALALVFAVAGGAARDLVKGLGEIAVNIATIWFRLRLSVIFPASLAGRTIGLAAAWTATKGRVWSLLAFWILIGLVAAPLALVLLAPVLGELLDPLEALRKAGADPEEARAAVVPLLDAIARLFTPGEPAFWIFAPLLYALTIASAAITNVAAGTAWRYLSDGAPPPASAEEAA